MSVPKRTIVRSGPEYVIVHWPAIPPEAMCPSYHVKIHSTHAIGVFPTFQEAQAWADRQGTPCPLLTPLPYSFG